MMTPTILHSHFKKRKKAKKKVFVTSIRSYLLYLAVVIFFVRLPRYFRITELTSSHNKHFVGIPSEKLSINKQVSSRRV